MHIRAVIGGRYTNVVFDIPVPIVDWLWEDLREKMLQKRRINEDAIKLKLARETYEKAAKLQAEIAADCAVKFAEYSEIDSGLKEAEKAMGGRGKKPRVRSRKTNYKKKSMYKLNGEN